VQILKEIGGIVAGRENIILIGGGGHCKACVDVIEAENKFRIAGIIDLKEKLHRKVSGYDIIATDEDLPKLQGQYKHFLVTIGHVKHASKRKEKFEYLKELSLELSIIVSPLAYVSKHAAVDEGTVIMHKAFVNAYAIIGKNCIVNSGAIVEHDVHIENHCHISTGSIINGGCRIQEGVLIGSNTVLLNNVEITENTIVGAGSVVIESINQSGMYAGRPVRRLDQNA
jgi:sugar O-acyltransferase (sialic acid O-acetyltransferase NeuD family)